MPEALDRLVVSLGLDPTGFKAGVAEANRATAELERSQQQSLEKGTAARRRIVDKATREESTGKKRQLTEYQRAQRASTEAEERAARTAQLGINPQRLGGLANALQKIGGSADDASASVGDFVSMGQNIKIHGVNPQDAGMMSLTGISLQDLNSPGAQAAMDKYADWAKKVGDVEASTLGAQWGVPQSFTNLAVQGGAAGVEAAIRTGEADAPTAAEATSAAKLQAAFNQTDQDLTEVGRKIVDDLKGPLEWLLGMLDQFAKWGKQHPKEAAAAGLGASLATGGAGLAGTALAYRGLRAAWNWMTGKGAKSVTPAEKALVRRLMGDAAKTGSVAVDAGELGVLDAALPLAILFDPSSTSGGDRQQLNKLFPNRRAINNPGNLIDPAATAAAGHDVFQNFPTLGAGVAAAQAQLRRYGDRGINTISGIVSTWAPPSDGNDDSAYIQAVASQTGFAPDAPLNLSDPKVMTALSSAMFDHEGNWYWRHRNDRKSVAVPLPPPLPHPGQSLDAGLPPSVDSYLASLRAGSSAAAVHHHLHQTVDNSTTATTHVGDVHVHTSATDAHGIARDMKKAIVEPQLSWILQRNPGLS